MIATILRRLTCVMAALILAGGLVSCTQSNSSSTPQPPVTADAGHDTNGDKPKPADNTAMMVKPAAPAPAMAMSGVSGSWKWSVDAGGTPINHSAKLVQTGETLTGTWTDSYGDAPVTADIKEGTVKDGQVSFKVSRSSPFGDATQMLTLSFSGKVDAGNDKIDGTITINLPGADAAGGGAAAPSEWHATRVKE